MSKVKGQKIVMSKREFVKEHRELAKLSPKRPALVKREAKEQGAELKRVLKKK